MARRPGIAAALSLAVAIVLADSAIVTLALPDILRELDTSVSGVSWVLTSFNLVLALAAVPAARFLVQRAPAGAAAPQAAAPTQAAAPPPGAAPPRRAARDPAVVCAVGVVVFAGASAACALAPELGVLIGARVVQALGGAFVLVASLELLEAALDDETAGGKLWAQAGVAGAALGPVVGGLLTSAISWQSIFIVQVPIALVAAPAALALRGRAVAPPLGPADRPHIAANLALALLSAALTAALFLLVLMLVEGWGRTPAVAAVTVTVVPVAAVIAGPLARFARAGTRAEAVAGAILMSGGLAALAIPPAAELVWTIVPQILVGLGLGLTVDSLTAVALKDRFPRALHGGWTISARHAGVVAGLVILTPIFTADLRDAEAPAKEAIASLVLDAPLSATTKLDLAEGLGERLDAESGRIPDLSPAFAGLELPPLEQLRANHLQGRLNDQLLRAATEAFKTAFLLAAALALLALIPLLWWRETT